MYNNFDTILQKEPLTLLNWLIENFMVEIPNVIVTVEDMENASRLLLLTTSNYSYLCALLSYSKALARQLKRDGNKELYEDMVDKREAIQNITDAVKQSYSAISRAVTIHIENNQELKMNANGYIT